MNSVDVDQTVRIHRLILIYTVNKSQLVPSPPDIFKPRYSNCVKMRCAEVAIKLVLSAHAQTILIICVYVDLDHRRFVGHVSFLFVSTGDIFASNLALK